MPRATVLIPTHEHAATLPYAVASVQNQGVDDIEILICGDGVDDGLRAVAAGLQAADRRIRFFDLPKGPRHGERNRDHVLRHATGEIVCYQADDDLWLPGHLAAMQHALRDADFVGAMHVDVADDDTIRPYFFDLRRQEFVAPWLIWKVNELGPWASDGFGLAFAGHRLDAYRRLPEGWDTTPPGVPTDQTMWHKFLRQPWCRATMLLWPVSLHFPNPDRRDWTPQRRAAELERWSAIIAAPDGATRIFRAALSTLGDLMLPHAVGQQAQLRAMEAERQRLAAALEAEAAERQRLAAGLEAALERERAVAAMLAAAEARERRRLSQRTIALLKAAKRRLGRLRSRRGA